MLLVFFLSCVPNTDLGVTLGKLWLNIHTGAEEVSVRRIEFVHACKSEAAVGSKTCIGLTYLELGVVNVPWLRHVSDGLGVGVRLNIPSWIP